jgi:hypothetical protein
MQGPYCRAAMTELYFFVAMQRCMQSCSSLGDNLYSFPLKKKNFRCHWSWLVATGNSLRAAIVVALTHRFVYLCLGFTWIFTKKIRRGGVRI